MNNLDNLPDGWTIYVWLVAGALIIIAVLFALRWAHKNDQFDENIKYLVFDENDKDKMSPAEFARSQEVLKEQMEKRDQTLKEKAEQRARSHEKR